VTTSAPTTRPGRRGFGWGTAGFLTGCAGLAVSVLVSSLMASRVNPVVGVAEWIIRITPGALAEEAISAVGHYDKPFLVTGVLIVLAVASWYAGRSAARSTWQPQAVFLVLAALGAVAVLDGPHAQPTDVIPVLAGGIVWLALLPWLTQPLRDGENRSRRTFLIRAGAVVAGAAIFEGLGRLAGSGRRQVEAAGALLKLPITLRAAPPSALLDVKGLSSWRTANSGFYQVHTVVVPPAIDPKDWTVRIHGMVDREMILTLQNLLDRKITEAWITLNCVSNEVGGDLIGNAWWSGVRLADLLKEAGVQEGADAVKQTSDDGWTCGTPLDVLTDNRNAMLAIGMNCTPLPIQHGFPVRTIVPGLYGSVSACKWVVDIEVTKFSEFTAYWTDRGWSEQGPVKLASRIDVPRSQQTVPAGAVTVAGSAWQQHTGVEAVEVSLDGGAWAPMTLGHVPTNDTWVQWEGQVTAEAGDHTLRVRAVNKRAEVQTGVVRDVVPDGATGWHTIEFSAE
jgi:DMSO/TMAO reductase YedYZ molybdopterin-dependent catalytic subunit